MLNKREKPTQFVRQSVMQLTPTFRRIRKNSFSFHSDQSSEHSSEEHREQAVAEPEDLQNEDRLDHDEIEIDKTAGGTNEYLKTPLSNIDTTYSNTDRLQPYQKDPTIIQDSQNDEDSFDYNTDTSLSMFPSSYSTQAFNDTANQANRAYKTAGEDEEEEEEGEEEEEEETDDNQNLENTSATNVARFIPRTLPIATIDIEDQITGFMGKDQILGIHKIQDQKDKSYKLWQDIDVLDDVKQLIKDRYKVSYNNNDGTNDDDTNGNKQNKPSYINEFDEFPKAYENDLMKLRNNHIQLLNKLRDYKETFSSQSASTTNTTNTETSTNDSTTTLSNDIIPRVSTEQSLHAANFSGQEDRNDADPAHHHHAENTNQKTIDENLGDAWTKTKPSGNGSSGDGSRKPSHTNPVLDRSATSSPASNKHQSPKPQTRDNSPMENHETVNSKFSDLHNNAKQELEEIVSLLDNLQR